MKLVVGTYILDNVTSTAYEEFVSYYSSTPASYITNADIERWNTRDDISQMVTYSYLSEKLADIDVSGSIDLSSYATISYVTQLSYELEKDEKVIAAAFNNINDKISYTVSYTYLSEITQNTYSYISEKISDIDIPEDAYVIYLYDLEDGENYKENEEVIGMINYLKSGGKNLIIGCGDKSDESIKSYENPSLIELTDSNLLIDGPHYSGYSDESGLDLGSWNSWDFSLEFDTENNLRDATLTFTENNNSLSLNQIQADWHTKNTKSLSYITNKPDLSVYITYSYLSEITQNTYSYISEKLADIDIPEDAYVIQLYNYSDGEEYTNDEELIGMVNYLKSGGKNLVVGIFNDGSDGVSDFSADYQYPATLQFYGDTIDISIKDTGYLGENDISLGHIITWTFILNYDEGNNLDSITCSINYYEDTVSPEFIQSDWNNNDSTTFSYIANKPDLSNYVPYSYLSEITQNTYSYISEKISDKATYSYLSYNFIDKWNLGSYVSELVGESTDNDVSNETISQSLNELKLDLDYNAGLVNRINSKYASKNYVDNNYMTKTLAYNTINTYLNSYVSNETRLSDITNLNSYLTNISNTYIKGELQTISFALNDLSYRVDNINIPDASNFISYSYLTQKLSDVPELINIPDLNGKYVSSEDLKGIVQKTEYGDGTADYCILGFNDGNIPVYRHISLQENTDTGEIVPIEDPEIVIKGDVADIINIPFGDYGNYVSSIDYQEDFKGIAINPSENFYQIIGFDENNEPVIRTLSNEYDTDTGEYNIIEDTQHIATQEYVDDSIGNIVIPDTTNFVSKDELTAFSYNIIPSEHNTYNLGALTYIWSNIYTQTIDGGNGDRLNLRTNGNNRLVLFSNRLYPYPNNYVSLGVESNAWKDTYTYNLYIWDGSSFADLGSYIRNIIQNG